MSAINVVWISRFGKEMASYRYRAEIPAEEVGKLNGFKCGINDGDADIVVFTKPTGDDIAVAKKLKADGAKIVLDLSDNHFHSPLERVYREIAPIGDYIVCASDAMKGIIRDEAGKDAWVIPDPYEFEEVEPHAQGEYHLWFGHYRNFGEMTQVMNSMGQRKLRVVTGPREIPGTIPWSLENLRKTFKMSNIVILPTQPGAEYKSANRLINSLRQGCFCVCMDHPAYREFRDFVWVGDFHTGLRWTDAFIDELNEHVKAGQAYIRDRYSPAAIGKLWSQFLEAV